MLKDVGVASGLGGQLIGQKSEEEELQVIHQPTDRRRHKNQSDDSRKRSAGDAREQRRLHDGAERRRYSDDPGEAFESEFGCAVEEVKAKKRTENSSGYCNKEVDRVLETAIKTKDAKQAL